MLKVVEKNFTLEKSKELFKTTHGYNYWRIGLVIFSYKLNRLLLSVMLFYGLHFSLMISESARFERLKNKIVQAEIKSGK